MRFYTIQHKFYCGIDVEREVREHQNIRTDPAALLQALQPFRADVVVCVECLCAWDRAR